jgi:hypothetical protein
MATAIDLFAVDPLTGIVFVSATFLFYGVLVYLVLMGMKD